MPLIDSATPLYSIAELRAIEQAAMQDLPQGLLMQRAGQAAASTALKLLHAQEDGDGAGHRRVLVLAGPGDNGGDALEAAAHLAGSGTEVLVWLVPEAQATSPEREQALSRARNSAARFMEAATSMASAAVGAAPWHLVIDGLFGIGASRPLDGECRDMAQLVNNLDCPVLALDVPSGLHADTGAIDGVAIRATHTLTFIGDKPGLHTANGRDHAGEVEVAALAIAPALLPAAKAQLGGLHLFARQLQPRRQNTHKGSYGSVAVIGGAQGMAGAPILAARTALHAGAGRVYIAFPDAPPAFDSGQPELMCRHARDVDFSGLHFAALVAGPGLGDKADTVELLQRAIDSDSPLLLDADALNLMAAEPELQSALAVRTGAGATILTPHPLEAARLLDMTVAEVQADRLGAARQLATQLGAIVVLKGSGTVIAAPDGQVVVNNTGGPALATAGTGDVLSGLCGSLLAQGWPEWEAAIGAVWLHGAAADALVAAGSGPIGLTAGELIPAIRKLINALSA
ncbi:NAD(P)H-hydrate dehydratase [Janthinobacterium lividum]